MSKSSRINLRAHRLWDLHAHLHAAAAGNDALTRIVDAAFSSRPRDAVDAETRTIADEIIKPTSSGMRHKTGRERHRATRLRSKASCPDSIDVQVSLTVRHRQRHSECLPACTRVQLMEDGAVVFAKPMRRVPRLSLPSNGPTSRNFRDLMVERGWTSHLVVYRTLAQTLERFAYQNAIRPDTLSIETALRGHESQLAPFVWCATVHASLGNGDADTAMAHARFRLQQLLGRSVKNQRKLLDAARVMREQQAEQVFQGPVSIPGRSRLGDSLERLLSPSTPSDLVFRGMFLSLATSDSCDLALNGQRVSEDPPPEAPAAPAKPPYRRPALGRALAPLLPAPIDSHPEPNDPRRWVLRNLEWLQRSLLDDWDRVLYRVRGLLVVLDADNAPKLDTLLSGPHEANRRAIVEAALGVQRLIDQARPFLEAMNAVVAECIRSIENRSESISQAFAVLAARDAFSNAIQRVRDALDASATTLDEHLQVLRQAQSLHVSRELDALIGVLEDAPLIKRAIKMRKFSADVQRLRGVADRGMSRFLSARPRRARR